MFFEDMFNHVGVGYDGGWERQPEEAVTLA